MVAKTAARFRRSDVNMRLFLPLRASFVSYSSILKSTISLNTTSIFEKNAPVAVYHNICRIDGFKSLNPNQI